MTAMDMPRKTTKLAATRVTKLLKQSASIVVDVVDDNERRAEFPNTLANRVDDIIEVIPKDTEKVQTDKVELSVVGLEALKHFIVMMGAGVGAVDGVDPEDLAAVTGRSGEPL